MDWLLPFTMAASGIQNTISEMFADKRQKQQIEAQRQLQKEQNEWNEKMWNLNNEYNSPINQIQLFKEAGLNPAIYMSGYNASSGSPASGQTMSIPSYAPRAEFGDPVAAYSQLYGTQLQQQSLDLKSKELDIMNRKADAEIRKTDSDISLNQILGNKHSSEIKVNEATADKLRADIRVLDKNLSVLDETIKVYQEQQSLMKAQAEKAIEEKNFVSYNAHTQRINSNNGKITAEASRQLYEAYGRKADSEIKLNHQQIENLVEQIKNVKADGKLKDIEIMYKGQLFKADLSLKAGQLQSIHIQNDIANKTKYAQVANAYVSVVDNAATTTSHVMKAVVDVSTGGASTIISSSDKANGYGLSPDMPYYLQGASSFSGR